MTKKIILKSSLCLSALLVHCYALPANVKTTEKPAAKSAAKPLVKSAAMSQIARHTSLPKIHPDVVISMPGLSKLSEKRPYCQRIVLGLSQAINLQKIQADQLDQAVINHFAGWNAVYCALIAKELSWRYEREYAASLAEGQQVNHLKSLGALLRKSNPSGCIITISKADWEAIYQNLFKQAGIVMPAPKAVN